MSADHVHDAEALPPPTLQEVSDGIFAYVQLDGSWCLNNTGFLVGRDGVTAIDTCATERRTRAFLTELESVTSAPVRVLVNTHHHGDHTHGNWLLPAAAVVGHEQCRHEVLTTGSITKGLWPWVEWGQIEVWPPFVTFDDHLSVWVDDLEVSLQHIGPGPHDERCRRLGRGSVGAVHRRSRVQRGHAVRRDGIRGRVARGGRAVARDSGHRRSCRATVLCADRRSSTS